MIDKRVSCCKPIIRIIRLNIVERKRNYDVMFLQYLVSDLSIFTRDVAQYYCAMCNNVVNVWPYHVYSTKLQTF